MPSVVASSIVSLITISMAEAVGCAGRYVGRCLMRCMIAVAFVAGVSLMNSRSLIHLLCSGTHSHVRRHSVAGPAAQWQQDHHENEHKKTHGLNDKGR